jgi:hypothetical protein
LSQDGEQLSIPPNSVGKRVATQDQAPDGTLTVDVGADRLDHIADRRGLGLDLLTIGIPSRNQAYWMLLIRQITGDSNHKIVRLASQLPCQILDSLLARPC